MSEFNFKNNIIHYEVYGEGKPLIILNGIMMTTKSWEIFKTAFSKNNKLILVDFLDQGASCRMTESYTQKDQVEVLRELYNELGIDKASLCGISYGGEVAIQFAIKYGDLVDKLVLSNTAGRTSPWLRDIGNAWNAAGENENCGQQYYLTAIPVIYSPKFYEDRLDWMKNREKILVPYFNDKTVMATIKRLVISAENYNEVNNLEKITAKTLVISCDEDYLTPMKEQNILKSKIPNSQLVIIPEVGHASMYEKPELWATLVLGFVNLDCNIKLI